MYRSFRSGHRVLLLLALLFAWLALTPRQAMSYRHKPEVRHRRRLAMSYRRKAAVPHRCQPAMCRWRRPVVAVRVTEEPPLVVVGPAPAALTVAAPAEVLPANTAPVEKAIEPSAAENKNGLPARGTYRIEGDEKSMSVFAVSVDAQELFTALADRANLRLVIDDQVSRRLTVNITNRPARQIIDNIAGAYGLAAADVDGVTIISEGIPRSPSSYLLSDIDSISTKYVDASNARNLLPVFLQDYVKVNSEQNAVVLSAPSSVLQKFREDIAQFDIPASQILVDLLLVELTDTTLDQFGLNFLYQNAGKGGEINAGAGSLIFRTVANLPPQFSATLRALEQKGQARVRANPRIATVSGRQASIFVGRQRYVVTPIDTGRGQTNYIDAGVRLAITPYTGGQRQVLVDVDTEVSTLSAPDPVTHLPEKSTRTATTTVRVNDGQTIVIGGLKQQESSDIRTRVPGLSHIPLLGPLLFRTKDVRSTNSELVLFITPRILSSTGHLPAAEERVLTDRFLQGSLSSASALPRHDRFELPTPQPNGGIVPSPRAQTGIGDAGTATPVPGNTP